jgi:hypothetical protein
MKPLLSRLKRLEEEVEKSMKRQTNLPEWMPRLPIGICIEDALKMLDEKRTEPLKDMTE